ncbi:MAG: cobalamin B12-binding domain-containing protein [Candidatus Neomarinimicrobiota bacterium]
MQRKIRILMAKPGLDGHDRGIKVLARAFRDAGMEVIYLGLRQTPEMIVRAAVQEDVDVVALSILSGVHMTVFPQVKKLMLDAGLDDVLLTGGGIIPRKDMEALQRQGVGRLFGPGSALSEIVAYITSWVEENRPGLEEEASG